MENEQEEEVTIAKERKGRKGGSYAITPKTKKKKAKIKTIKREKW